MSDLHGTWSSAFPGQNRRIGRGAFHRTSDLFTEVCVTVGVNNFIISAQYIFK
jgi:hypothetical protein